MIGGIIDAVGNSIGRWENRSKEKSGEFQRSREEYMRGSQIQARVADAKAAGIHPLFALGASGGYSGGGASFGQSRSGTQFSTGGLGSAIDRAMAEKSRKTRMGTLDAAQAEMQKAQIRNLNSRSQINEIEAMARSSEEAKGRQDVWSTGAGRGNFGDYGVEGGEARTFPLKSRGRDVHMRPLTQSSRSSIPEMIEIVGDDGYRYRIVNPALGDEVAQGHYLWEKGKRQMSKAFRNPRRGKRRPRPKARYKPYTRKW